MRIRTGTSGFAYPQWRGSFYPAELSNDDMLSHYAQQLPTVEINNTFYRMPKPAVIANWVAQAPAPFEFIIKASQRITHRAKLVGEDAAASMKYLFSVLEAGGLTWSGTADAPPRLGAVLLQTPAYVRATDATIAALDHLAGLAPAGARLAFELSHASWHNNEVAAVLAKHGAVGVIADRDDGTVDWASPVVTSAAAWAYIRLRRENYSPTELQAWVTRLRERAHADVWVFFKHEDTARGAEMALELTRLTAAT